MPSRACFQKLSDCFQCRWRSCTGQDMPWAGHWPFLSLSPTQSQRTDAIRHWALKQPMMTQGFALGMTLVPSKSRDAGKSPPATLSWQQWVWGGVATIQQQVVNPSRCWVNTCPQSKARRTVRYIFGGGGGGRRWNSFSLISRTRLHHPARHLPSQLSPVEIEPQPNWLYGCFLASL